VAYSFPVPGDRIISRYLASRTPPSIGLHAGEVWSAIVAAADEPIAAYFARHHPRGHLGAPGSDTKRMCRDGYRCLARRAGSCSLTPVPAMALIAPSGTEFLVDDLPEGAHDMLYGQFA
jgi:hypothetical protein